MNSHGEMRYFFIIRMENGVCRLSSVIQAEFLEVLT